MQSTGQRTQHLLKEPLTAQSDRPRGRNLLAEQRPAWALAIVWGEGLDDFDNIVWGNNFGVDDNIVWGNAFDAGDNIVWGNNIVWANELNTDDTLYFSHAYTKLLPAEVLLDAISNVNGTTTQFDGLPSGMHATQSPDGKMENPFLKTFGRPARELACECERESDSNLSQALQLIGGATVNGKLRDDSGRMAQLARSAKTPEQISRELYLVALAREPSSTEVEAAVKHLAGAADRRQAIEDLGWVLINSKEFLFRH